MPQKTGSIAQKVMMHMHLLRAKLRKLLVEVDGHSMISMVDSLKKFNGEPVWQSVSEL